MSGFLTKPLDIMRLHETFDRFGFGVSGADPREATVMSGATAVPVDLVQLSEITDGDAEFAHELASTFISSGEEVLREIHAALAAFDRVALSRAAHKLKGASANIHAEPLRELAFTVETQAAQLDQPRLRDVVERLHSQFQRAAQCLQANAPPPAARAG
jgi:HPt (histidine-containing phosphotransfer) domain-containing protein